MYEKNGSINLITILVMTLVNVDIIGVGSLQNCKIVLLLKFFPVELVITHIMNYEHNNRTSMLMPNKIWSGEHHISSIINIALHFYLADNGLWAMPPLTASVVVTYTLKLLIFS